MDLATRGGREGAREQLPLAEGFMKRDAHRRRAAVEAGRTGGTGGGHCLRTDPTGELGSGENFSGFSDQRR